MYLELHSTSSTDTKPYSDTPEGPASHRFAQGSASFGGRGPLPPSGGEGAHPPPPLRGRRGSGGEGAPALPPIFPLSPSGERGGEERVSPLSSGGPGVSPPCPQPVMESPLHCLHSQPCAPPSPQRGNWDLRIACTCQAPRWGGMYNRFKDPGSFPPLPPSPPPPKQKNEEQIQTLHRALIVARGG